MRRALLSLIALAGCIDAPSSASDDDAQLLLNAGFEEGVGVGWIFQPGGGSPLIGTVDELGIAPHDGTYAAEVGNSDGTSEVISQAADVPEGVTGLTLSFHRCVLTDEAAEEKAWDYCSVRSSSDGSEAQTLLQESNAEATEACVWSAASITVTSFTAGAPLEILLVASNDVSDATRCLYDSFALTPD